jgi:glycosyltransferase involved in cell wall biosynthesis
VSDSPTASVILPAHNEADNIVATLEALTADAGPGELEIVVVCNGCTDDTAEVAATVPGVRVEQIETPSKLAALRTGDRVATVFPRIYLDADIRLPTATVRALAEALSDDAALVAGVPGRMDLSDSGRLVSLFYEFRDRLPVYAAGGIGAGVYALSRTGRARFDDWPDLRSGDDQFIRRLFAPHERATLPDHATLIEPPPDLRSVIRRGVRTRKGNTRLSAGAAGRDLPPPPPGRLTALREAARTPRGIASACVFIAVTVIVRVRVRLGRTSDDWIAR